MGLTSVLARSLTCNTHSHAACGTAGISLDLSHVMANVNHRAKSADPVGMGVSALNNDDQGAYEGGGGGGGGVGGGGGAANSAPPPWHTDRAHILVPHTTMTTAELAPRSALR